MIQHLIKFQWFRTNRNTCHYLGEAVLPDRNHVTNAVSVAQLDIWSKGLDSALDGINNIFGQFRLRMHLYMIGNRFVLQSGYSVLAAIRFLLIAL